VERIHGIVKKMIRVYLENFQRDWDLMLPFFEMAYNTEKNTVTKYTPYFLHFGRAPTIPMDLKYKSLVKDYVTTEEYVETLRKTIPRIYELIKDVREEVGNKIAENHNKKHKLRIHNEGIKVILVNRHLRKEEKGINKKVLKRNHDDIYEIKQRLSPQTYIITNTRTKEERRVRGDDIEPFLEKEKLETEEKQTPQEVFKILRKIKTNTGENRYVVAIMRGRKRFQEHMKQTDERIKHLVQAFEDAEAMKGLVGKKEVTKMTRLQKRIEEKERPITPPLVINKDEQEKQQNTNLKRKRE
jgi:hypothetical protein